MLQLGSVIEHGNWGRVNRLPNADPNHIVAVLRESALENARRLVSLLKQSRLNCVFLFDDISIARKYGEKYARSSVLYEVTPINEHYSAHIGDYEITIDPQNTRNLDNFLGICSFYWSDCEKLNPEILIDCPVRVLKAI